MDVIGGMSHAVLSLGKVRAGDGGQRKGREAERETDRQTDRHRNGQAAWCRLPGMASDFSCLSLDGHHP